MLCFMSKQQLDDNPPLLRSESVRSAVEHLELLGAVERKEGQVLLTALGKKMASFPLEPRYAKVKKETERRLSRGNKLLNMLCPWVLLDVDCLFAADVTHTHTPTPPCRRTSDNSPLPRLLCLTDHPALPRVLLFRGGPVHRVAALSGQRALQPPRAT